MGHRKSASLPVSSAMKKRKLTKKMRSVSDVTRMFLKVKVTFKQRCESRDE
jgi:hypothetical protein